ncbi:UvrD-helicase domain-containing protein [Lactococcus garvieae]|uniref:UvrD-helicase domain-containing protein n=1 Tax=Lactococcus garvieae TaxID=1363 RepID=UPI003854542A
MKGYITPTDWVSTNGIELEESAIEAVKCNYNALVVAGPGAGKTELLAQKTDFLFKTNLSEYPRKILAISFKKDAADNLRLRTQKRYGNDYGNRFVSLTFDSFSKRILDQFRLALPKNWIPIKEYLVEDRKRIEQVFTQYIEGFKYLKNWQKKNIIEQELFTSPNKKIWRVLLRGDETGPACLTFKMINFLAKIIILKNPKIKKTFQVTYSHVFLDEFQDTTGMQYDLMKLCFLGGNSVVIAVGDNKQRIMEWAGAKTTIFFDFQQDFNANKFSLIMNHRSAPRLVELQKMMYESLEEKELSVFPSKKWSKSEGEIKLFLSENDLTEAEKVVNDIINKIKSGINADEICILVKQLPEKYSSEIIALLKTHGIRARIENLYQSSLKESIVTLLLSIFKISLHDQKPEDWDHLEKFYFKNFELEDCQNSRNFDIVQKSIKEMVSYCADAITNLSDESNFQELVKEVINKLQLEAIFKNYPEYAQGNYFNSVLEDFKKLFWEEYCMVFNFKKAIRNFQGEDVIPIMTIHKSKGLEYEAIYLVGLEDSAWWNFKNKPKAERSAFFVAISRARQYLTFSYCSYRESLKNFNNPSGYQSKNQVNEFFELLTTPNIAEIVR